MYHHTCIVPHVVSLTNINLWASSNLLTGVYKIPWLSLSRGSMQLYDSIYNAGDEKHRGVTLTPIDMSTLTQALG